MKFLVRVRSVGQRESLAALVVDGGAGDDVGGGADLGRRHFYRAKRVPDNRGDCAGQVATLPAPTTKYNAIQYNTVQYNTITTYVLKTVKGNILYPCEMAAVYPVPLTDSVLAGMVDVK